jgi:hypothetical protein
MGSKEPGSDCIKAAFKRSHFFHSKGTSHLIEYPAPNNSECPCVDSTGLSPGSVWLWTRSHGSYQFPLPGAGVLHGGGVGILNKLNTSKPLHGHHMICVVDRLHPHLIARWCPLLLIWNEMAENNHGQTSPSFRNYLEVAGVSSKAWFCWQ